MADKKSVLSPREMETLALTWQCFTSEPKVRPPNKPNIHSPILTSTG